MKDKEKAYRDKVLGAQFIEFLRRRPLVDGATRLNNQNSGGLKDASPQRNTALHEWMA